LLGSIVWSELHSRGINNLVAVPTTLRIDFDYKLPTTKNIRTRNTNNGCHLTLRSNNGCTEKLKKKFLCAVLCTWRQISMGGWY